MRFKPLPPFEEVNKKLIIDATSPSGLSWKVPGTRGIKPGDRAGKKLPTGYWHVRFNKETYYAHRLIFLLQTGKDPMGNEVDHASGKENPLHLRLATSAQNNHNLNKRKNTKSKYKGVRAKRLKWQAGIYHEGKYINLGIYQTEDEAAKVYDKKAKELWGDFARANFK